MKPLYVGRTHFKPRLWYWTCRNCAWQKRFYDSQADAIAAALIHCRGSLGWCRGW